MYKEKDARLSIERMTEANKFFPNISFVVLKDNIYTETNFPPKKLGVSF